MTNREKLQTVLADVFLLSPDEVRLDLTRDEIDTWDSLGVVSLAVGIHEAFGYHMTPQEATGVASVPEVARVEKAIAANPSLAASRAGHYDQQDGRRRK